MSDLSFTKTSGIYNGRFFTVAMPDTDISLGIFPEDQGLSPNRVFLWDSYKDLIQFENTDLVQYRVILPDDVRFGNLTKCVGSVYSLPYIKSTWRVEKITTPPRFVE